MPPQTPAAEAPHHADDRLAQSASLLRIASRVACLGGWTIELPDGKLTWSDETCALHDLPPGYAPTLEEGIGYYPAEHRAEVTRHVEACATDGTPYDIEVPKITATGRRIWVRSIGEAVRDAGGRIIRLQGAFQDISERRRVEEALREREAELRALAESMPQMVWMTRPDGFNIYFNQRWVEYTGLTLEESHGHGWITPFHPDDTRRAWEAWQAATAGFAEYSLECRLRRSDGVYRWMLIRGLPFRDRAGQVLKWMGTCTDIDDLKQAAEAIRAREEHFRLLADATNDAIWDWNLATNALWWGEGFETLFGHRRDTVDPTLRSWTDCIHPADLDRVTGSIHRAIEDGCDLWSGEYRFRRSDGCYAYVLDRGRVVRDDAGRAVRMVGGVTDLTERKQAEDQLRDQATLLDSATDGIFVRDLDHRITYWSKGAERLYGWSVAEALARSAYDLLHGDDRTAFREATERVLSTGAWSGELAKVTRSGHLRTVESRWTLLRDEAGQPRAILAINTDITTRRQLEQQYLRAQRMESIGTLASGIAHDLNNVLTPIMMSIGTLQDGERDPERLEVLATLERSATRGGEMVNQVLSFARGMDGRRVDVDLRHVVRDLVKIARDTFPKNIQIDERFDADLWTLRADPTQLQQVLLNLCVNARDAMPAGGHITIRAANVRIDEHYAAMNIEVGVGPHVVIDVEDDGAGIPREIVDRIFDPFFTTKEQGKGTGLGLATSLAIVKGHGGTIRAYSVLGAGSRLRLYLPAQTTPPEQAMTEPVRMRHGRGETVLVIDDEPAILQIARRTLQSFGYRVLVAADGAEALAVYAQHRADIAVVLTDMMMPVMDGPATIQRLLRLNPEARIVATSGLATSGTVARAAGVSHFLAKPYTAETLLGAIGLVLVGAGCPVPAPV